ncbi:MAG: TlpA disulfide reductase family protein [Rhodocyclaceae bacterium]|nr:TlpA disulfide reductase family protein [Rhodocyclaceae bacterium]
MNRLFLIGLLIGISSPLISLAQESDPLWVATLTDLNDKPVALQTYKGRPLVVNFWARWCGPCREEIPDFIRARGKYKGVELLGIAIDDKTEAVRDFAKAYEMDYPVLLAKDQGIALMKALGNTKAGLPYTLVIDRSGRIVQKKMGPMKRADIEAGFQQALK